MRNSTSIMYAVLIELLIATARGHKASVGAHCSCHGQALRKSPCHKSSDAWAVERCATMQFIEHRFLSILYCTKVSHSARKIACTRTKYQPLTWITEGNLHICCTYELQRTPYDVILRSKLFAVHADNLSLPRLDNS